MDEFSFIKSIQQQTYNQSNLIKGVGDDAAVLRETNRDIVTAVDVFTEGVHFTRETMKPYHIGYKALAANVSDMAAMGATPTSYLVALIVPDNWDFDELTEIYAGMKGLASEYKIDLIGGDTVSGKQLTLSITIIGSVEKGKSRYRNLARDGDIVFVTGTLGDSRAGLQILTHDLSFTNADYFINKHRLPIPRVNFAKELASIKRVALNDISDGIANEAREIAVASNVTVVLEEHTIPTSKELHQFTTEQQHQWKLFGGEDFEILGSVPEGDWDTVQLAAIKTGLRVTKVGYVSLKANNHVYLLKENSEKVILNKDGYTHLSR